MKRNAAVLLILAAVLTALLWAGWHNFERRKLARENQPMQLTLVPSAPGDDNAAPSSSNPDSEDGMKDLRGQMPPAFTLANSDGQQVSLADYKGKAVLVNFWAVWCAPCKVEMPWFAEFQTKYGSQGFQTLGIVEDEPAKDEMLRTAAKAGVNYPILLDVKGKTGDSFGGVDYLPESFYIGRNGKVVEETSGLGSKDEVEANIKKALATQ